MSARIKYLCLFVLLSLASISFSQPWLYNSANLKNASSKSNFEQTQIAFENYWQNKSIERGRGYKQFKRWEYFMEPRIGTNNIIDSKSYWDAVNKQEYSSSYDTLTWTYIGPENVPNMINTSHKTGAGRLNCIAFHPQNNQIIYVGAPSGGLWISEDYGQSWTTTTDKLNAIGISDIAVVQGDTSTIIFLATGDGDSGDTYSIGIIRSDDGGETWTPTSLSLIASNQSFFRRVTPHLTNKNILFAASSNGLYRTSDMWQSYSMVSSGNFRDIEIHPYNPNIIYASTYNSNGNAKIYRSDDGGTTFEESSLPSSSNGKIDRIELAVSRASVNLVYALCSSAENGGFYAIYRSSNSGESWSTLYDNSRENLLGWSPGGTDIGGQGWYDLALAVSPVSVNNITVGGINNWRSENGGTEWMLSSWLYHTEAYPYVHADQHMMSHSPHTNELFVVNDGGVYRSEDDGQSWIDITNNLQILQTYRLHSSSSNSQKLMCGNQDNGTFFYNATDWQLVLGGDGMNCLIDSDDENIIYGSTFNGSLYKSIDGGVNFESIKPDDALSGAWITPFIQHPHNSAILYAAYNDIYKSNDKGATWLNISEDLSTDKLISLSVAESNDNYIYTASKNKIFKTTNGGIKWEEIPISFADLSITNICISPNDPNKIWISLSGYNELNKVFFSANGGESWINYSEGLPNVPVNDIVMRLNSKNELYAATDIGVYYINSDTSQWVNYSLTLPNVIVSDLEITDNTLKAGTYGRGIWQATLPQALPSKANFESNILSGCIDAPIQLYYKDTLSFDSLKWNYGDAELIAANSTNDTISIVFSKEGKKTIQLLYYSDSSVISEIKYEYLDIRDTLDIQLFPSQYNVCDSNEISIQLRKGYQYNWAPETYLDTTKGAVVNLKPLSDITYTINAQHGTCNTILELPVLYMPNNICDAIYLATGSNRTFANSCATAQTNEPTPPVGTGDYNGCLSQDGWCYQQDSIENSLWFKVVVPENGTLGILTTGFDTQIALYQSSSCNHILNGDYLLIAANDDINISNTGSAININEGLTPGDTLYLQLDGSFNGTSGDFTILVDDKLVHSQETTQNTLPNLTIYPNPASSYVEIKMNNHTEERITIDIIDQTGRLISSNTLKTYSSEIRHTISTESLKGMYIIRIHNNNKNYIRKLIVQ